jgi:hypothetical protein
VRAAGMVHGQGHPGDASTQLVQPQLRPLYEKPDAWARISKNTVWIHALDVWGNFACSDCKEENVWVGLKAD